MALGGDSKLESDSHVQDSETVGGDGHDGTDKDLALGLVGEHAHAFDHGIETKVLRKIDLFFIPAMIIGK
jgi:hypothetical protein